MNILHLTENNQSAVVDHVVNLLQRGGVVAVPTDTVYGLVADATRESAVKKIFRIKARSYQKALPVFVRDAAMAKHYAFIDAKVMKLLEELWPGKTTVVLRKKDAMPDGVTGGMKTVGFRISDHPFIRALTAAYPHPLAETSANLSGSEPAQSPSEVQNTFHRHIPEPDLLVDGGRIASAGPSTVLDLTMPSNPKILRMGAITKGELDKILAAN
ncbi:MAG: threonylcarbamoyl-AMP synthase [Candidatus Sungbacteria bacterium RIFCSPLOWO2_01_FULL_60_25]|uniref:L-threonylcarbamoyladenylate synthase n=1 Tax=Candidatus Sungbacteria bacterium RIFCSPLOWO2_01_FULL_60_25 TaxID=1802281 RepID=A0A1G2LBJ0_9BACT|nr:MAG: threonylcarbamoyl-AMP synthase [Candidatus Sungbacteria bacterium RIFCSPLOWO2_01_FULL_60_25]